jgi:hypothetical protein
MGAFVYFYYPFINKNYNDLVLSAQKLKIIKLPAKENNNTNTIKIPPMLNNKIINEENNNTDTNTTKIPPTLNNKIITKENIIPVNRKEISLFQHAIRYINFLNIGMLVFGIGFIMLISSSMSKNKKESEKKDAFILSEANKISKTPRQAKMIYNHVNAIALIGKKDFHNTSFPFFRDWLLDFIFKSLIYLYIIITDLLKPTKLHKFKTYHNELLSMLLGSSKTKQDFKNFKKEISYIITYIQIEEDKKSSYLKDKINKKTFYLKDKLSIIDVKKYNANKKNIYNFKMKCLK